MTFLRATFPTRHHLPLPSGRADASGVSTHPAHRRHHAQQPRPGRTLPLLVTSRYVKALEGAVDIWDSGPKGFVLEDVARERAQGRRVLVLQRRSARSRRDRDRQPGDRSARLIWAAFKHDVEVYFYWHAVHWRHNAQKRVGDRNQNVWAESITFDNRAQPNKPIDDQGYIHGDGVLLYPGEERLHPDEDRACRTRLDGAACKFPSRTSGPPVPHAGT